jgi:hypothetical protein
MTLLAKELGTLKWSLLQEEREVGPGEGSRAQLKFSNSRWFASEGYGKIVVL